MKFGDYLRQCREAKGWTQPEAARHADIEQSYLSKLETGRSYPSEDVYSRLVQVFDIDTSELTENITAAEIERLRELAQVRDAVLSRESRALNLSRGWMLAGLAGLMLSAASAAIVMTSRDAEYAEYHYRSQGVLELAESLDSFAIVNDSVALEDETRRALQSTMVARLDEDYRIVGDFHGRSYIEDVPGGRRYFELVDDRIVSQPTPMRWFMIPALVFLAGALGSFFISFRWKR
ncbi:helix-turn-helix domain-containing protein [Maricaulis sp. MIT060901]|uniref:helix-turn-helix domain-containing protein n=2 Tax=unclassified Maricaulis TaxID=2632371 RepID=UPI0039995E05